MTTTTRAPRWLRAVAVTAAGLGVGIVVLSFALSFTVLRDLAMQSGIPRGMSWAWPVVVDLTIVVAMLAIIARRGVAGMTSRWPWAVFATFTVVSVCGNAIHAVVDADSGVEWAWLRIAVGAVPPVALLCSVELVVGLLPVLRAMTVAQPAAAPDTATDGSLSPDVVLAEPVVAEAPVSSTVSEAPEPAVVEPVNVDIEPTAAVVEDDSQVATDDSPENDAPDTVVVDHAAVDETTTAARLLHIVDPVPTTPAEQTAWIVDRARAGQDVSREGLEQAFAEADQELHERTIQRRLAAARKQAPEAFAA